MNYSSNKNFSFKFTLKEIIKQIHILKRFNGNCDFKNVLVKNFKSSNCRLRGSPQKGRALEMKSLSNLHLIPGGAPACSHPLVTLH